MLKLSVASSWLAAKSSAFMIRPVRIFAPRGREHSARYQSVRFRGEGQFRKWPSGRACGKTSSIDAAVTDVAPLPRGTHSQLVGGELSSGFASSQPQIRKQYL